MKLIRIKQGDAGEAREINRSAALIVDECAEALKRALFQLDSALKAANASNDKGTAKAASSNAMNVKNAISELSKVKA